MSTESDLQFIKSTLEKAMAAVEKSCEVRGISKPGLIFLEFHNDDAHAVNILCNGDEAIGIKILADVVKNYPKSAP